MPVLYDTILVDVRNVEDRQSFLDRLVEVFGKHGGGAIKSLNLDVNKSAFVVINGMPEEMTILRRTEMMREIGTLPGVVQSGFNSSGLFTSFDP